jgi:hypothetical protein
MGPTKVKLSEMEQMRVKMKAIDPPGPPKKNLKVPRAYESPNPALQK